MLQLLRPEPKCPREGCGGVLRRTRKDERFYLHRGVYINVPESFSIPKCSKCRGDVLSDALEIALTAVLEQEYQQHAEMIKKILEKYGKKAKK